MLPQIDGLSLSPVKVFSILIFHLLIHLNRAESQVVGPHQPVVALVDDDVILPCHVEPAEDVTAEILEWTRSDLNPRFVHVWRSGQDLVNTRNPSYRGRSSLFINELKRGNISLKLSRVKLSDGGTYECSIPLMEKKSFVKLVVASHAARSLLISLSGTDENRGGVVLQCESAGWYPEPELLWLDGEGNLLSAGPTETLRGPDDLYTVSSRVTVEKRHSNNINCRVQQKQISKSRETHKHVPDEFFELTSCSAAPIVIGLAVSLAVSIILILIGVFFIWRQNKTNVRRAHCDACKEQETANRPETDKTERDQEQDKLMSQDIVPPDTSKPPPEKSQTSFEEQNKSGSANHSSKTGDITVVEVEKNGNYIFLKNTSSENKLLSGWKLKLQINNRESATYEFKENFILKAGETLLLRQDAVSKPIKTDADLLWMNMVNWNVGDDVKIDLISNTGEEQMLLKNKIM
ncbi:butyrophilin subfamily 3 member A2 isoform X2 [Haplochromis burtoni]|uniref:butyrophilin subfamily 3 member A2 isoform X2 n=1 Tax=Haplochromis burtoni TaxID=8153 RepID=UPI001C2DE908|nr:butyrophilin subfamily 3 member A2 isoform X2 [Haplochromis burtoni]